MAVVDDQTSQRHGWGKVKLTVMNPDTGSDEDTSTRHSNKYATGKPSTRPPPTPSPPYPGPANPPSKPHTTQNLTLVETSDNPKPSRRSDSLPGAQRTFSPARQMLSPAALSTADHIVVAVTRDAENYVSVDLSGYTEAQAIREHILSKLDIADDLHPTFSIYQTELHGYAIGGALDDTQLLIKCQLFGDDKGSLKFLVQPTDITPTSAGVVGVFPSLRVDSPARIRQSGEARPERPSAPVRQSDSQRQSQDLVVSPPPQQHPARQQPSLRPLPPVPQYPVHSQAQITHSQSSDPREYHTPPPQQLPTYTPEQGRLPGDQRMMGGQLITDDQTATLGDGGMTELVGAPSLAPPGSASAPPVSQQSIPPPTQPLRATTDIPSQHFAVQEQDGNYRDLDGRASEGTSGRAASSAAGTTALPARQSASNPKEFRPPVDGTSLLSGADSSSGSTLPLEARHDSDRLAVDARLGGDAPKALPVAEKPAVQGAGRQKKSLRMMAVEREKALQRRTIRRVHNKDVSSDSDSDSVPTAVYFTRRNAKVWGGRVKKATPGGTLGVDLSAQDPGTISDGPRKQGGWRLQRAKAQRLGSADDAERDVETDDPTSNTRTIVMIQSGQISCEEMFQHLVAHGCKDLSSDMDPEKYSSGMIIGGAFGDIWKGKLRDGREVAIKVWRFTSLLHNGSKSMKRAMREIYYWSKIKHEYVQELMGVIMFQGRLGMVSLWMGHGNLREYIYKHPSVDRYSLCYQVASGIAYLHSQDMVHGDLKGVNILVSPGGDAKLSDFDHTIMSECSLVFSETSRLGGGTTRWMAPELILDDDCRRSAYTDVYALGMTMLEIITNNSPYYPQCKEDVNVIMTVMKRQLPTRPLELLGDNPRDNRMWELLLRCWDYDPLARPKAVEVVEWLQGIIALPTISGQV